MEKDPQAELLSIMSVLRKEAEKDSYCDEDGVRYSSDGKILLSCPVDFSGQYVIKSGVTEICSQAFRKCSKLTSVIIRDSVKEIGCCSFELCTGLDSIKIPSSVTTIDMGAFTGSCLKSVIIPGSVKSIDSSVFENCRELSYVVIREGVSTIGDYAFNGCVKLKIIKLPSSITKIGVDAFANCPNLIYVIVPDGAKSKFVQMGLKNVQGKIVDRKDSIFTPDYFPEFDLVPISSLPSECSVFVTRKIRKLDGYPRSLLILVALGMFLTVTFGLGSLDDNGRKILICALVVGALTVVMGLVSVGIFLMIKHGLRVGQRKLMILKNKADFIERRITERDRWGKLRYGLYRIAKNKKLGMLSFPSGDIVLEPIYDYISVFSMNYDYGLLLEKDGKYGLLIEDKIGVPVEYDKIDWMSPYILIYKNGKVGACKSDGIKLLPVEYDSISYDENRRIVKANKGAEVFYFDEFGKPLV